MSTNITTVYKSGDGIIMQPAITTVIVGGVTLSNTAPMLTRIVAIHAFSTVTGLFDIGDKDGSKIQFQVPASGTADIYIGDMGIRCEGTVSVATPQAGSVTLILG
jgi:hypothetical protein|tara:strand:- start:141 stop:455 length:315 start_codon:yes stop_codon:yes gene_type:complete